MATKLGETYKCQICTNVVVVKQEGQGTLVCCGKPMTKTE
ncbi:desulfoferrodoxin FeS4 iron-binding domain-containing protein [Candidatus Desulforudis audaxviator]|uniref:Desulfoferrodoxin Dfx domain protein n=1 Tax=Desulforudis audaxviator (strain MP104C) TaxID=477974 RepID=B1I527_DESAP|nr:desulfoferrodoxin FeS4 iron-binding domain-containing protein [Candidatus Desulforudis audaxviator]ACA60078.1 Desulfoferrodoxin Dfx domain protein [Candidatus Desulforudis audaxviator MP104C]AZK60116.1 desulfoferrodoxin FeS4 iron-binding domain-containing protein [Candidatus Desulforudis audaxviator]